MSSTLKFGCRSHARDASHCRQEKIRDEYFWVAYESVKFDQDRCITVVTFLARPTNLNNLSEK